MKYEGNLKGIPVYSDPIIEDGVLYIVSDVFHIKLQRRKDGLPDMRYRVCKTYKMLGYSLKEKVFI